MAPLFIRPCKNKPPRRGGSLFIGADLLDSIKPKPDEHYAIIQRVAREVSEAHGLKPSLKVERVDWFHDGTSYGINDKIIEMMSDCGLLIGNLTHCNPNVYHEVGFVIGKAKAEGKDVANMLLFLDESVAGGSSHSISEGSSNLDLLGLRWSSCPRYAKTLSASSQLSADKCKCVFSFYCTTRVRTSERPHERSKPTWCLCSRTLIDPSNFSGLEDSGSFIPRTHMM
ncbi:MAG: hypothetical protein KAY79_02120 [Nitrospira sp.]|nr:hypothetical protein [Nitrospira sp.]